MVNRHIKILFLDKVISRNLKYGTKGFSITEVMIAMGIIALVSVAVLTLLASAFRANALLRNTVIASGLAEEGVELIRAIRDGNWLEGKTIDGVTCGLGTDEWREGLCSGVYVIDYSDDLSTELNNFYASGNDFLCRNANGYYIRNNGVSCPPGSSATQFRRQIIISNDTVYEFVADVYIYWCRTGVQPCPQDYESVLRVEQRFSNWLGS
ncbi:MAG: hypothetical protein UU22_C0041G0006 [Parcubacteria group bacterium GW2011_GWA2_40_8]|nr:MAG: hypothetical protein UT82_C0011G0005 [Parcubacteria group bacterium GW2011_GWB1_40_14]KKR77562.1 MAG: hypothetical protein UU22_C0041G0006 [Parcubacteria group bacterium GW2011_GWA2_40_8]